MSTQRAVPLPIASGDLELDKTGSGWVLTAWPAVVAPAVLRLCIHEYLNVGDPFLLVLEVRFQHCKDFTRIVVLDMTGDELLTVSGREDGWPTVPAWLQPAFLTMAQTLGAVLRLTELGGTPHERYPGEPFTSRDYFFFGAADDLPKSSL